MSDEFDRITRGGAQVGVGLATLSPMKTLEGVATVFGLETNASIVQKAVALAHEDFVFETVLQLKADSAGHKQRLDTYEQRLKMLTWTVEEFERRLGERGAVPSDLAALLEASFRVWQATADAKKREFHRNALRNAFDPKQYEEGLTLRLFGIFEELTYGDIWTLRRLKEHHRDWPKSAATRYYQIITKVHYDDHDAPIQINNNERLMVAEHMTCLRQHRLIYKGHRQFEIDGRVASQLTNTNEVTELGDRFLALMADPPEPVPAQ